MVGWVGGLRGGQVVVTHVGTHTLICVTENCEANKF